MACKEQSLDNAYRTYVWNYFSQHSEQRLKTFNFYIILCAVIIGALATLASKDKLTGGLSALPISLLFLSFLFWKLDQRTRMLIQISEIALKYLDRALLQNSPSEDYVLALFEQDEKNLASLEPYPLLTGYFSYTRVFNWFFIGMGMTGLIITIFLFYKP